MKDANKVIFMGGFTGIIKKETSPKKGQPFYMLNFAVANDSENHFGYDVCSIGVEKEVYQEFMVKAKINGFINAIVKFSHGYWDLSYYQL